MDCWLAFPVEPRLQTLVDSLFEDLGIRQNVRWIVPKSMTNPPSGPVHVWDQDEAVTATWQQIAQRDLESFKRFPDRTRGFDLRSGLSDSFRFHTHQGRTDSDQLMLDILTSAYVFLSSVERLFRGHEVSGVFLWNQWGFENLILRQFCRKYTRPFWFLEQGLLSKTLCFSKVGLYDEAHEPWMLDKPSTLALEDVEANLGHYQDLCVIDGDKQEAEIPSISPLVLAAGQLDYDSSILFRCPDCMTNKELLSSLTGVPGVVVFKPHPYDKTEYGQEGYRLVSKSCDLHKLIRACDVLVTRNSTSGIEAILHDKPVVHVGRAIYHVGSISTMFPLPQLAEGVQQVLKAPPTARPGWEEEKHKFFRWLIGRHLYLPAEGHPKAFRKASLARIQAEFGRVCAG